jgi:ParB family chromosome partitioning protein
VVAIENLLPNREQPRKHFDSDALQALADSIRAQGIIQPLVVTPSPEGGGRWVILAGERRWRAAQLAGLHEVPVVVRETPEAERLELALVENLQRADLNAIEEAQAYADLMKLRGFSHEQVAARVGRDRSTITNAVRLLRLPEKVQQMVVTGELGMGHARALLGLDDADAMLDLARKTVRGGWSVRAVEREVRRRGEDPIGAPPQPDDVQRRAVIVRQLEERLRARLGVKVALRRGKSGAGSGTLEIPYASLDELDRVLRVILDG